MITYDTDYIKNLMYTYAYQEAHKRINQVVEKPGKIINSAIYDDDFGCGDVLDALFTTVSSIPLECEDSDEDYNLLVNEVLDSVHQASYNNIQVVFHFGLLIDYRHLFTTEEYLFWKDRMRSLFDGFCPSIMTSLDEYVRSYFMDSDFEREVRQEEYFWKSGYTFVFTENWEYNDAYTFDGIFWNTLADFTEDYYNFYEDLTAEIEKRKRG